jgi:hypothetical protein
MAFAYANASSSFVRWLFNSGMASLGVWVDLD